ncbi:MotA/TolQ/ExbB proton channel family protein [uncultured Thiothrix sp.]|uniref:MotA/TolQ/ExbB proton channel family protein n=1 Tax=uncultured Thiothrix sp. TaxID=223185 RepID=UPI00260F9508|nr:MotA/TolQ/ExbB proton channel family protein [uncultured Thiothrix sp.]HMT92530.1 MotA/TolQ/ExbB proton channel family protein [Thiolinea sp.]
MLEVIIAGGVMMIPIILASIVALAIIFERFWALRRSKVIPVADVEMARQLAAAGQVSKNAIDNLGSNSVVGSVLATGLASSNLPRHVMKENVEEAGRHAVHRLERYLPALATIGSISPLMGLLGTVFGMISSFSQISKAGAGDPAAVAGGISEALITTAAGLVVALVAVIFHRFLKAKVDNYVISMEQEAVKLIEVVNQHNNRRPTASANVATNPAQLSANEKAAAAIAAARQRMASGA